MNISIAIDGPAAAGKSTVAKRVAKILGYTYIDTGAMYRSVTLYALQKGIDCQDEERVNEVINDVKIDLLSDNRVFLNGNDVTKDIRTIDVTNNVSYIATYKKVRLHLVDQQRKMAGNTSVVMDGRDIGTYVLPNAQVKIFQIASVKERAIRRYEENISKGIQCELDAIEKDLIRRDDIDSHRDFAPLRKADDAISLDTTNMSIEEVVDAIIKIVKEKTGEIDA